MKRNPILIILAVLGALAVLAFVAGLGALYTAFSDRVPNMSSNTVAVLEVKGIIMDSRAFVKSIQKYRESRDVKALVIRLDSPGGVVGPSQEMYDEVLRTRQMGKPVVASLGSLAASGAYYIAAACDKIITNPGTITGSIGVIMEFADLSRLYDWAHVRRYVIKSGEFKDAGSEYRPMTSREQSVMQEMIDNVFMQFKQAVAKGRKLKLDVVSKLADGRIYSGEQAVKNGLADEIGGLEAAVEVAGKLGGIKGKPETYFPNPKKKRVWDLLFDQNDDDLVKRVLGLDLTGRPLFLMPSARY